MCAYDVGTLTFIFGGNMENKKNGNVSSFVVVAFSFVAILLVATYIGTSIGSKGTFSASEEEGDPIGGKRCTYRPDNGNREIDTITYCDKLATDANGNVITCDAEGGRAANADKKCYHMEEGRVIDVYDRCNVYPEDNWR